MGTNYNKIQDQPNVARIFTPTPPSTPAFEMEKKIVEAKVLTNLNLRSLSSIDGIIVETLLKGSTVVVKSGDYEWAEVISEAGNDGFVMSKFIEVK